MTRIEHLDWQQAKNNVSKVRECVFVYEWGIPLSVEFDEFDLLSDHVLVFENEQPIATGRLCQDGYLSRVAVLPSKRNTEAADMVITELALIAKRRKLAELTVSSDLEHVLQFTQAGYKPASKVFMEAGVPRQKLCCSLDTFTPFDWNWAH